MTSLVGPMVVAAWCRRLLVTVGPTPVEAVATGATRVAGAAPGHRTRPRCDRSRASPTHERDGSAATGPPSALAATEGVSGRAGETVKPNGTAVGRRDPVPTAPCVDRLSWTLPGAARPRTPSMDAAFTSKLPEPRQRFLAQVVEHGLTTGLRTPEEFLRHFSPTTIMHALADEPARRARILETTIGHAPQDRAEEEPRELRRGPPHRARRGRDHGRGAARAVRARRSRALPRRAVSVDVRRRAAVLAAHRDVVRSTPQDPRAHGVHRARRDRRGPGHRA